MLGFAYVSVFLWIMYTGLSVLIPDSGANSVIIILFDNF